MLVPIPSVLLVWKVGTWRAMLRGGGEGAYGEAVVPVRVLFSANNP